MAKHELFLDMAKLGQPAVTQDDRNIFDSRIEGDHLGPVGFTSSPQDRTQFYQLKFQYYSAIVQLMTVEGIAKSIERARESVGIDPEVADVLDEWFADEIKTYLLRRLQSSTEIVHSTWYNDLPAFAEWASLVSELSRRHSTRDMSRLLNTTFPVCIEEEMRVADFCTKLWGDLAEIISAPVPADAGVLALRTERLRSAISRISARVAARIASGPTTMEDILNVVVCGIRDECGVRVCDYLEVTSSDDYPRLRLLVSSWESDDREAIRQTENAYAKAGGITGSVFLLEPETQFRWVGSNHLTEDPRQSLRHRLLFESVYGETKAFLVLPVFDGWRMAGAIRAIDPVLDEPSDSSSDGRPGTWPLNLRVELCHLAEWVGSLLPLLGTALPGGAHDSPLAELSHYRPGWLDWIPIRYLSSVLTECVRIASMRSEHRAVGCTIALGTREACETLAERARSYPAVQRDRRVGLIESATDLFGRVVPGAGAFVCQIPADGDAEVLSLAYSTIVATGELSSEAAARRYDSIGNLCFLDVNGSQRVVRFFQGGRWVGDYFVNEKTGRWQLRARENLLRRLMERTTSFRPQLIANLLIKFLVPYSYEGHGGLILLADSLPRKLVAEDGFDVNLPMDDVDSAVFSTIVSVDGGTWIDTQGTVREAGIIFASGSSEEVRPEGGARHKAAQMVSSGIGGGVVFAISANRVITCLSRGHAPLRL